MKTREEIIKARAEWLASAKQQLIETDAEIALFELSDGAWEAVHKLRFPGSGYAATMRAQSMRLQRDIARHEAADRGDPVTFIPGPVGYRGRFLVRIESPRLRGWVELDATSRHSARLECDGAFPRCVVTLWERESDGFVSRVGVISAPANAVVVEGRKS